MGRLTGEQRYRQARQRANIIFRRTFRDYLAGKIPYMDAGVDIERKALIREIERAYEAGRRDALSREGS